MSPSYQLELSGRKFTASSLKKISSQPSLKSLSLDFEKVSDDALLVSLFETLVSMESLRSLKLANFSIGAKHIALLSSHPSVETLVLSGLNYENGDLLELRSLRSLRDIKLERCYAVPSTLRAWKQLTRLRFLHLTDFCYYIEPCESSNSKMTVDGYIMSSYQALSELEQLTELTIEEPFVTRWHLRELIKLPRLKTLGLYNFDDEEALYCAKMLPTFPSLCGFSMLNYSDEYDFLDVFASWKSLTFLSLSGSSFSLEEIKKIAKVKGLQRLGLPDATLPKGSLEVLSYLPSLKTLNLSWCKGVSTEEWEHLRSFSKLRSLDLSDSRFNTNIVDILLSIKSLRHLNLKGCSPASLELEPLRAQLEAFGGELLFDQRRPFFMDTKYIGTFFVGGLFGVVAGSVATLLGQDSLMTLFPMLSLFWIWIFMMCAFTFGAVKVLTEE